MKKSIKIIVHTLLPVLWFTTNPVCSQSLNHHVREKAFNNDSAATSRIFQLSLLPYISINQVPTNCVVDVSVNLIAGYVQEVRAVEVGGVLNMDRADAGKCQLAGVGNMVGGSFQGFQAAGVYNMTRSMKGVQAGGVINMVKADAGYCQLAGIGNSVGGSFHGFQAAGVFNMVQSMKGVQTGGVINITKENAGNCQLAGVGNRVGGSFQGFQAAGVFNLTKNMHGVQLAGVLNKAQEVSGMQISGLINWASFFKGVQLSVFNFADSCNGIPIGVMSFVRKNGYQKIELSADEVLYTNIAFRTGVTRFYTIVMAGIRPDNFSTPLWAYGYGIGTRFGKQGNFSYDLELSAQHISKGNFSDYVSDLHKLYFGIDRKIFPKTSIAVGVTYNFFITDTNAPDYNGKLSTVAPYTLTNDTYKHGINMKTWIGGKIALRFL